MLCIPNKIVWFFLWSQALRLEARETATAPVAPAAPATAARVPVVYNARLGIRTLEVPQDVPQEVLVDDRLEHDITIIGFYIPRYCAFIE